MSRFLQYLFALGLLLLLAGLVQEVRLKVSDSTGTEIPAAESASSPTAQSPLPPTVPAPLEPPSPPPPPPSKRIVREPAKRPQKQISPKKIAPKPVIPLNKMLEALKPAAPAPPQKGDFDPKILKKEMPKPVEPPTDVELPQVISEKGQWIGSQSGITEPLQTVFRNAADWNAFWEKAIAPYSSELRSVPAIDFAGYMVVGVFMGKESLAGYQIRIVGTETSTQGGEKVMTVRYKNIDRFLGIFAPQFEVRPFHLFRMHSFPGKIEFVQVKDGKK